LSVPRIATLAAAAVTRVNHVLETASSPDFFSSLLSVCKMKSRAPKR
jgi:biotin synthase-like enzyme